MDDGRHCLNAVTTEKHSPIYINVARGEIKVITVKTSQYHNSADSCILTARAAGEGGLKRFSFKIKLLFDCFSPASTAPTGKHYSAQSN